MSGRFTGELNITTLVLPSLNRFINVFCVFEFVQDVGEIHRSEFLNTLVLPPMNRNPY